MSTELTADAEEASAERPRMSRAGRVGTAVAVVVSLGIAVWLGVAQANQPVRWQNVGFAVPSATEAQSTFDVFLYTDAGATCRVRALNSRHAEVGAVDVHVDRAAGRQQRLTVPVVTVEQAATVVVAYCASP